MVVKLQVSLTTHVKEPQSEFVELLSKNLKFNLKDGLKLRQLLKMKMEIS